MLLETATTRHMMDCAVDIALWPQ